MDGAGDRTRTGDIQLGKLTLYQLSYTREYCADYRGEGQGDQGIRIVGG